MSIDRIRLHRAPRALFAAASLSLLLLAASSIAGTSLLPTGFTDTRLAGTLSNPIALALVPDAAAPAPRILFAEQRTARLRLLIGQTVTTVGTVPSVQSAEGERGLLGVTVDPGFPSRPYVYVHATDNRSGRNVVISRFTLTGDLTYSGNGALAFDAASRYDLLDDLPDNASNHNGGTVRFGPDGRLYVSIGDDAVSCNAQLLTVLAGKILRLDVSRLPSGPGGPAPYALLIPPGNPYATNPDSGARLVWVSGLRNPFRFHIDAGTGDLHVADVGEGTWEELTRFSAGGQNGGWPWREGPVAFGSCSGSQPASIAPIASYNHSEGVSIISAGVYRRPASGTERFPADYEGDSFYLDYYSGLMRRLTGSGSTWTPAPAAPGQPNSTDWAAGMNNVSDVLALPDGTLLYVRQSENYAANTGEIRRIAYEQTLDAPVGIASRTVFSAASPSPSKGRVRLAWTQPRAASARLSVFDASGRVMRVVETGAVLAAGAHQREWDGTDGSGASVRPGLYFARLEVAGESHQARVVLIR